MLHVKYNDSELHLLGNKFYRYVFLPHIFTLLPYIGHSDDDAYLNTPIANLGEIKLEIWTCKVDKNVKPNGNGCDLGASSNVKVHERSKKVGTHRIQYVFWVIYGKQTM